MLNRFGQSLPPLMASDHIRQMRQKKRMLAVCAGVMGLCFIGLSLAWQWDSPSPSGWLPIVFLGIYGVFFIFVGLHNLSMSLMYGKLIPVTQRGRLMLVSMTLGCGLAVFCAWFLLRDWLGQETGHFELQPEDKAP